MKTLVEAWTLLFIIVVAGPSIGGEIPRELCWVPPEAVMAASLERDPASSPELFERFRSELLFALGHEAGFEWLGEAMGPEPGPLPRVLVVSVRGERAPRELGFLIDGSVDELYRSLSSSPRLEHSSPSGRELLLAPDHAVARLEDETMVFGSVLGVLEVVERFRDGTCERHERLEPLFENVDTTRPIWGVADGAWLDFDFGARDLEAADVAGRSLSRSLSRLRSIAISSEFSENEARLTMRTAAHDAADARILLDELRTFIASASRNAPEPVKSSSTRARVSRVDSDVSFTIPLDGAALSVIRRSQTGRNLLRWRLGPERRELTGRISSVLDALALGPGSRVGDVGAGGGFFTVRLARAVGRSGRVYAVDIDAGVVEALEDRVVHAELGNVESVLGTARDPRLPPASLDAVLIVNAYHEMGEFDSMLAHIRRSLKPNGRLVIVEPFDPERRGEPREAQVERHEIAPEIVEAELREHDFGIVDRIDAFISHEGSSRRDSLIVARRAR